ncbi:MAG: acyl carrier protein [Ruminococcaceae bacterium]|nr:acyl carrier protein [Oscillospiraceae bacterium]
MDFENLQGILAEMFSVEEDEITMETDFYADLYADSLDMLEVWYVLEEEYDLNDIDRAKISDFRTVGQIVDYIR